MVLFLVGWIFKSELRFRVPFDASVMIYAVLGAKTVWTGLRRTALIRFGDNCRLVAGADGSKDAL